MCGARARSWRVTESGQPALRRSDEQGRQRGLRADLLAPGPRAYATPHQQREQAGSATSAAANARCASIWLKFHASTSPCDQDRPSHPCWSRFKRSLLDEGGFASARNVVSGSLCASAARL